MLRQSRAVLLYVLAECQCQICRQQVHVAHQGQQICNLLRAEGLRQTVQDVQDSAAHNICMALQQDLQLFTLS